MMSPTDIGGVPVVINKKDAESSDPIDIVFRSVFSVPGGGLRTAATINRKLLELIKKASQEQVRTLQRAIRFYSTAGHFIEDETWKALVENPDDPADDPVEVQAGVEGMKEILGLRDASKKAYSITLSDENFVSPMTIGARDAEMFLNFMPSYIMSRCVPYLSAEFVLDRPGAVGKNNTLNAPGLLKFLLGAQDLTGENSRASRNNFGESTANNVMLEGNSIRSDAASAASQAKTEGKDSAKTVGYDQTIAGMEMFTAPQTLTNPVPLPLGSRYVPVLDQMRPLASIENITINVRPTFGLMSFKTAQLTLKIHDRSRLNELADLIKPLIYSRTTVWLTYGWRHPIEPNNPYANFINNRMLTREAFGIANSSYDFDQVGQATVTLQLYTKGTRELRDIRITEVGQDSFEALDRRMQRLIEDIRRYRKELRLDKPVGILKEIRAFQLLEAASNGSDPNIDVNEISKVLDELENSFLKSDTAINKEAADKLKEALEELYSPTGSGKEAKFAYKERFDQVAKQAATKLLKKVRMTADPFLMSAKKDQVRQQQQTGNGSGQVPAHPFAALIDSYNNRTVRDKSNRKKAIRERPIVSFGKLFSVFVANAISNLESIDELQLMFYPLNQRAGKAAGTNIAEFPIDMDIFLDQYRDHISRRRTDKITLEEFLKLIVDAQLQDVRGIGFGLFGFLEPYDPTTNETKIKKGKTDEFQSELAQKENELGSFKLPVVTMYVETSHVARNTSESTSNINAGQDLLASFERDALLLNGARDKNYTRVMRIHVFDKAIDPYPLSTAILKGDDGTSDPVPKQLNSRLGGDLSKKNIQNLEKTIKQNSNANSRIGDLIEIDDIQGVIVRDRAANKKVKDFVSQTVPTIVYGSNGSMVTNANISTKQDATLTSVQMMAGNSGRPSVTQPNGGGTMGLPLRIIPASVSVETMGCPMLRYSQIFFFDYNTGTTIDNKYVVTGINHSIGPGQFKTSLEMSWYDAYGQYESKPTLYNYLKLIDAPLNAEDE